MTELRWKKFNKDVEVAVYKTTTFVLTRVPAGRPNRFDLVVTNDGQEPIIMGNELTPGHCRRIANEIYQALLENRTEKTSPVLQKMADVRSEVFNAWMIATMLVRGEKLHFKSYVSQFRRLQQKRFAKA